jgi:tetratricopeptide (TPR) repeat protein
VKTESPAYTDATFKEFLAIESGEYKKKVRFVALNREKLNALSLLAYVRVMNEYAEALFELGRFRTHIEVADELIELSIIHNVTHVGEKDLYQETLFQKAASLYNLKKLDQAIYILRELLRINPDNESARLFLVNCHVRQRDSTLQRSRKLSIVVILISVCIITVELLLIRPQFPAMTARVELTRNVMFLAGTAILLFGEIAVRYRAVSEMYRFREDEERD